MYGSAKHARVRRLNAGVLACLDGYMNIAMEQTEEYVDGQVRNSEGAVGVCVSR